jgi:hypothetical protein
MPPIGSIENSEGGASIRAKLNSAITLAEATVSANALGTANNPVTSASAARPSGLTRVYWVCPTQPTNWLANDEWVDNS